MIGEGLTGLWRVAVVEPPMADMRDAIGARAMCIAGMAIDEQIDASEAAAFAAPSRVQGAWFIEGETRMDDQQHALSALVRTMSIADADTADGVGARGDVPSVWLWILALVAAFNPARVALGVPSPSGREAERRRERTVIAAIGVAVGSVVLLAVAGVSDALLDAFYVSAPAFRIAAGIVGAAAGVYAMFVRHRSDLPVLPGRRAASYPWPCRSWSMPPPSCSRSARPRIRGLPVVLAAIIAGSLLAVAATVVPAGGTADRSLGLVARAPPAASCCSPACCS